MKSLLLLGLLTLADPAQATLGDWPRTPRDDRPKVEEAEPPRPVHRPRPRVRVVHAYKPTSIPVPPARCLPATESVGDQALSANGARENADKAWQQMMRFERGELFADPQYAEQKTYWCVKSSVGTGLFYRCRLKAKPCAPAGEDGK